MGPLRFGRRSAQRGLDAQGRSGVGVGQGGGTIGRADQRVPPFVEVFADER